jgi:hypothetical protein
MGVDRNLHVCCIKSSRIRPLNAHRPTLRSWWRFSATRTPNQLNLTRRRRRCVEMHFCAHAHMRHPRAYIHTYIRILCRIHVLYLFPSRPPTPRPGAPSSLSSGALSRAAPKPTGARRTACGTCWRRASTPLGSGRGMSVSEKGGEMCVGQRGNERGGKGRMRPLAHTDAYMLNTNISPVGESTQKGEAAPI